MKFISKYNILILIIVFLLVTNVTTVVTFIMKENNLKLKENGTMVEIPDKGLGRFFRDELGLNQEQHIAFREQRRKFRDDGRKITQNLQTKRRAFLDEMSKTKPDTAKLEKLSDEIGDLHKQLKQRTYTYFFKLKSHCNVEQQEKLFNIFRAMNNPEIDIRCRMRKGRMHRPERRN